jgi:caffeoyl-CoA O-methyltransferase
MDITDPQINQYIEEHSTDPGPELQSIERQTFLKSLYPRMISGKTQGRFLAMVSKMIRPTTILEIGTFTGYSAICLQEGLAPGGKLHTIEIDQELSRRNNQSFASAGVSGDIVQHFGDAIDIIPNLGIFFDLIFIDADKVNYGKYYQLSMKRLKIGGFMLVDNVLWSGKVIDDNFAGKDKETLSLIAFNKMVQDDQNVENVIIPLRDGMTLIHKLC